MAARNRSNPLALAVLICLAERPMHPYEVGTTLRQRGKHNSVRLNYGSLYAVIQSLEKRGLIVPKETERPGRLPERTIYEPTDAGLIEVHDWLTDLLATPVQEYPAFEAALSFLPALPPSDVLGLLRERSMRLQVEIAEMQGARELIEKAGLPRLFWVEVQFKACLREAELEFVNQLISDIDSGSLDGLEWWNLIHDPTQSGPPPKPQWTAAAKHWPELSSEDDPSSGDEPTTDDEGQESQ
jgi:DNA-binding PadR family transcriptional regulator